MRANLIWLITAYSSLQVCLALKYGNQTFKHREDLPNKTCPLDDRTFTIYEYSLLVCAAKCAQNSQCKGFSYDGAAARSRCIGCRKKYTSSLDMAAEMGSEYYEENTGICLFWGCGWGLMTYNTVDSRYLEIEGTLRNSSRYPYFDISDL